MRIQAFLSPLRGLAVAGFLLLGILNGKSVEAQTTSVAAAAMTTTPTICVLGVAAPPFDDTSWWGADGHRLPSSPLGQVGPIAGSNQPWGAAPGLQEREVLVEIQGTAGRDYVITVAGVMRMSTFRRVDSTGDEYYLYHVFFPASLQTCAIHASNPWRDMATMNYPELDMTSSVGTTLTTPSGWNEVSVFFSGVGLFDGEPGITIASTAVVGENVRVVFSDSSGKIFLPVEIGAITTMDGLQIRTLKCPTMSIKSIRTIKFQMRPDDWTDLNTDAPMQAAS